MKTYNTALEAKVAARNAANAEVNRLAPLAIAAFAPLVGKKVMKVGGLMAKYASLAPVSSDPQNRNPFVYREFSHYGLRFTVKTLAMSASKYGTNANYAEPTFQVGRLSNDVLMGVDEFKPLRTDYTAAEVLADRKVYAAAKDAADEARGKLFYFGEYDN